MAKQDTKLFLAVDVETLLEAGKWLAQVGHLYDVAKVGMGLMDHVGAPAAINIPKQFGLPVFADRKIYDIPKFAKSSARGLTSHGVEYLNVMAEGTRPMMEAVMEGVHERANEFGIQRPKVIAVTIPTSQSYDDLLRKGIAPVDMPRPDTEEEKQEFISRIVMMLAEEAVAAGVDCLLSSPLEGAEMLRKWPHKEVITPGIRNPDSPPDDQKRKMSPYEARMSGITNFVIGRLITQPPEGKTMADMAKLVRSEIARAEADLASQP